MAGTIGRIGKKVCRCRIPYYSLLTGAFAENGKGQIASATPPLHFDQRDTGREDSSELRETLLRPL